MNYTVEPQLEDREMVVRYTNGKGEKRIHGGKDLKGSQAYPRGTFGFDSEEVFECAFWSVTNYVVGLPNKMVAT